MLKHFLVRKQSQRHKDMQEMHTLVLYSNKRPIKTKIARLRCDSEIPVHLVVRIAVAREAQQVAMEQELLESLPLLYKNQPEQVTMTLECKGKSGQPCQGPANITVTVRPPSLPLATHSSFIIDLMCSYLIS